MATAWVLELRERTWACQREVLVQVLPKVFMTDLGSRGGSSKKRRCAALQHPVE